MTPAGRFNLDPDSIFRGIGKLPSLPAVAVELLASIDDENADASVIAHKIARDQALVARLLRIANSPFYGLQNQVNSIQDAVVVLGLRNVRMLATAALVAKSFAGASASGFDFRVFWRHAIATALCARALARRLRLPEENAFTAGLLHDLGRLVLASCFPEHLAEVVAYQTRLDCYSIDAERAVLATDHAQIGQLLAERWRFPAELAGAIADHHAPDEGAGRSPAAIVHVANAIAHALDLAGAPQEMVPRILPAAWNAVGLSWQDSQEVFREVEGQFDHIREALLG